MPTADIARAFLVSEPAMARRLTRAKSKIAATRFRAAAEAAPSGVERRALSARANELRPQ